LTIYLSLVQYKMSPKVNYLTKYYQLIVPKVLQNFRLIAWFWNT